MTRTTLLPEKQTATLIFADSFLIKSFASLKNLFYAAGKKRKHSLTVKKVFYDSVNFSWDEV